MEHKADEQGNLRKVEVWHDGQSPRIYFPDGHTPVDWVRVNHKRGVKLYRLLDMAVAGLGYIKDGHGYTVDGFTSTQWHEVRHAVRALSLVTGESLELGEWVE